MIDFYIAIVLFVIFVLYIFLKVPNKYIFKFIMIPLLVGLAFWGIIRIDSLLGRPYEKIPTEEFTLITYQVKIKPDKSLWIEIWTRDMSGESRLYVIPYSQKTMQDFEEAKKQEKQSGDRFVFSLKKRNLNNQTNKGSESNSDSEIEVKSKRIPKQDLLPPKN